MPTKGGIFFIKSLMGCDQWLTIWRALWHIPDEVFVFLEQQLVANFQYYWIPHERVALDETLVQCKVCHCQHIVYDKSKPAKRGLKYYLLVDQGLYAYWLKMSRSKKGEYFSQEQEDWEKTEKKTLNLVKEALENLPIHQYGPYHFAADSYYGFIELAEELDAKGICFTLACSANWPAYLFSQSLHKELQEHPEFGKFAVQKLKNHNMLALSWKDHNLFNLITNDLGTHTAMVLQHQSGSDQKKIQHIPAAISLYNLNMGFVDFFNANLKHISPYHKNFVWRRAHFLNLLSFTF